MFIVGLREKHKVDKRQRIFNVARERFEKDGFEATTIRAIAADAGVAAGTVMLYANSKHELFQEVWREEMMPVVADALTVVREAPLPDSLLALFSPLLRAYAARPELARVVVKELPWLEGRASQNHRADLNDFLETIATVVGKARQRGETSAPPRDVAELLFTVYYGACWRMLRPDDPLSLQDTIDWLKEQVEIILRGYNKR